MEKHIKNYLKYFRYDTADFIPCENCGAACNDFHHLEPRSKFGNKRKDIQDNVENVIALCRDCHNKAHQFHNFNQDLKLVHRKHILKHSNDESDLERYI